LCRCQRAAKREIRELVERFHQSDSSTRSKGSSSIHAMEMGGGAQQ